MTGSETVQGEDVIIQAPLYGGLFSTSAGTSLPFVLPGERVSLGSPLRILSPSASRTHPGCLHFGTCGGCHYQHAAYPAQLELKRTILSNLFANAGLTHPEIQTESGPEWHYRNRIRLRIEPAHASGAPSQTVPSSEVGLPISQTLSPRPFRAGYSVRGANDFLPITMCPIAAPVLWRAAQVILSLAASDPLVRRWLAISSEIELLCTPGEQRLQLQFFVHTAAPGRREASSFPGLCERIKFALSVALPPEATNPITRVPAPDPQPVLLTGASATLDPALNRRNRMLWKGTTWGDPGLAYPAAGRAYWLPRGAFFQVNRFLIDRLVDLVTANQSGELAWDLYAGVGLFTRALAEHFTRVVAVEGAEAAIASLQAAAKPRPNPGSIEPLHSPTLDFLRARELQRERPQLIVLDPPRAGLGREAAAILARIAAPRVVYVSCDPTTLALDLKVLSKTYEIEQLHLIDLFPQTFHIESVTALRRMVR